MWNQVIRVLNMAGSKFVLGSLRAGGATFFFAQGVEPGRLKYWGRWASEHSTAHYLQEASAAFVLRQLPIEATERFTRLQEVGSYLLVVPQRSLWGLCLKPRHG